MAVWERVIHPAAETTLEVTVSGPPGSHVTVTIWTTPLPEHSIYGSRTFGSGVTTDRFALPEGARGPYQLRIETGGAYGRGRARDGSVPLNGVEVVAGADLRAEQGRISLPVGLVAESSLATLLL